MKNWDAAFEAAKQVEDAVAKLREVWPASYAPEPTAYWFRELDELATKARSIRGAAGAGIEIEAQRRRDEDAAECATEGTCEPGAHHYTWPCELAPGTGRLWKEYL